ncbi:Uncharacterized membrane protein YdjX, TVP38/TMEM64 family, SNARE-associated domain [Psychrobacillus psychrotolerans]|uniref:TVP38/TMEM64 family membrane protein n=1 Tax=Psychrobacillus psychrotolerans TaxID=126156 RepID=A0A1I5XN54_9BACI|nr:VTT domain-containing protein [Psychrobacillus psychrotolerans]SFQ33256.1 Uncharacterized membrane protein YdjX, TVP38/TMEM64 family, SNARE-associated domain [Psychrobacillus psychrotolerans]
MKNKIQHLTKRQWIIWGALLLVSVFVLLNKDIVTSLLQGDIDEVQLFLERNIGYALFFMALVMIIQNSFTIFPLILVITINITLFGFINGFLWSWFTSIIASVIVLYGVRYVFQEIIIEKFNKGLIDKVDANGFAYVLQGRLFPFIPTSLINILSGLSTIRVIPFTIATAIGNFLYFFVLALIPAGILSSDVDEYVIFGVIFATILIYYLVKYLKHHKKKEKEKTEPAE